MYKKISISLLLMLVSTPTAFLQSNQTNHTPTITITHADNQEDYYDELDFLADIQPPMTRKPAPVPHWVKSVLLRMVIHLANFNEYCKKTFKKITFSFNKKQ